MIKLSEGFQMGIEGILLRKAGNNPTDKHGANQQRIATCLPQPPTAIHTLVATSESPGSSTVSDTIFADFRWKEMVTEEVPL